MTMEGGGGTGACDTVEVDSSSSSSSKSGALSLQGRAQGIWGRRGQIGKELEHSTERGKDQVLGPMLQRRRKGRIGRGTRANWGRGRIRPVRWPRRKIRGSAGRFRNNSARLKRARLDVQTRGMLGWPFAQ